MKNLKIDLFLSLTVLFFQNFAFAQDIIMEPVTAGRCVAIALSKTYLSDPTKSPVQFSCVYQCGDNSGKVSQVKAIHLFHKSTDAAEMTGLVCRGVVISYEQVDGQMRGDMTAVKGFWAKISDVPEIKSWALQNQIEIPSEALREMRNKMNSQLREVQKSYSGVDFTRYPEFQEAGEILGEIASESSSGQRYLNESLARVKSQTQQKTKSENLVDLNISALGRFLL